jgi:aminoglycoside phosphotransferase (APT) family kinase protein
VDAGGEPLVLREYASRVDVESASYEHDVLRALGRMGWPVAETVAEPVVEGGRVWCLFKRLPGAPAPEGLAEKRARGRLLAELHAATASLTDIGQRPGYRTADALIRDPALAAALRRYETIRPEAGHVLRWHLDEALALFYTVSLDDTETIVLHGDFAWWNLLFEGGKLSGILDFEATHRNYRVSDFALAWRGYQGEVVDGYQEVQKLTDRDRQILVPAFWSWLFLGVMDEIERAEAGGAPAPEFDWQIKKMLIRSERHGVRPYRGYSTGSTTRLHL